MTVADAASVAALAVDLVALYFLVGIWRDDRAMRFAAEESLKAQLEYLGLRRSWYASRVKKSIKDVKGIHVNEINEVERGESITVGDGIRTSATSFAKDDNVSDGSEVK